MNLASQTLTSYQTLRKEKNNGKPILGIDLPEICAASLNVIWNKLSAKDVIVKLSCFSASYGWTLYRDRLDINPAAPSELFFTEGEWSKGDDSIHVKLLSGDCYLLTEYKRQATSTESKQCFRDQEVFVRKHTNKQAFESACYRLWWQLDDSGKWLPFVQQFLRFNTAKGAQK